MASIDQMKGLISSKGGIARSNLFAVELPSLPGATSRDVNLLCKDVILPGRQITTYDKEIGTKREKVAYGYINEDVSMTFLVLNDYGIKKYFETWQSIAYNPNTYQIGYKSEYALDNIKIHQLKKGLGLPVYSTPLGIPRLPTIVQNRLPRIGPFDLAQGELDLDFLTKTKRLYTCILYKAWPVTIESTQLTNELEGITELRVQLAYTKWTSEFSQYNPVGDLVETAVGTALTKIFR